MHKESVHSKQKSRATSDISQPHGLAHATKAERCFSMSNVVKGQWKIAEMHLKARFVYLLQICHKGCALPPQDIL